MQALLPAAAPSFGKADIAALIGSSHAAADLLFTGTSRSQWRWRTAGGKWCGDGRFNNGAQHSC